VSAKTSLMEDVPDDITHGIVVYPVGKSTGCAWYGMAPEQVVICLRGMADEIEEQRCQPVPDQKH
jgi:hypothetical protein